jgi:Thioredoxin-like
MKKMPELVKLGKELGDRGLVIVGINFDRSEDKMRAAIDKQQLTWPQVYASAAAKNDAALWRNAAGIEGLPRFLVVDKKGILRSDAYPQKLAELVKPLLDDGR